MQVEDLRGAVNNPPTHGLDSSSLNMQHLNPRQGEVLHLARSPISELKWRYNIHDYTMEEADEVAFDAICLGWAH